MLAPVAQTSTKFLTGDFSLVQIIWVRGLGHTLWMMVLFWPRHGIGIFRSARPWTQLARSTLLFLSSVAWITAVSKVPLATASAMGFTAPIMVVLLSIPLLGERVGRHRWAAVLVGFCGALVIIRPGADGVPIEIVLLLISAFLFALYQIMTRKLAGIDNAATSSTYTVLVALFASSCVVAFDFHLPAAGAVYPWLAFLAIGLFGGFRHFFVIKAYEQAPASVISPFFYVELIGVTILGFIIFGDFPDLWTWVGAAIIIVSGLYIAHREARTHRLQTA